MPIEDDLQATTSDGANLLQASAPDLTSPPSVRGHNFVYILFSYLDFLLSLLSNLSLLDCREVVPTVRTFETHLPMGHSASNAPSASMWKPDSPYEAEKK